MVHTSTRYKPQIEEALAEVEKLGESRQSQMNRVKLVEKEKGALEVSRASSTRAQLRLDLLTNRGTLIVETVSQERCRFVSSGPARTRIATEPTLSAERSSSSS
jgi:hypothetical protein